MASAAEPNAYHDALYHYTTKEAMRGILTDKKLIPSKGNAAYGIRGQYFTLLGPGTNSNYLKTNNWDGARPSEDPKRTEYYIEIPRRHLPNLESVSRNVDGKVINILVNRSTRPLDLAKLEKNPDPPRYGVTHPKPGDKRYITLADLQ